MGLDLERSDINRDKKDRRTLKDLNFCKRARAKI
jgi:hypothetical protein